MIGIAPHCPITFVFALCAGSMSHWEIFKQSVITKLLTADMAIMVEMGFLMEPRLRVHVERCILRVKKNKLFDKVIPLSVCGSIDQLLSVLASR